MGLAPYGEPRFADTILEHLIDLKEDGSFRLNQTYFDYCTGLTMTDERFSELFGVSARNRDDAIERVHMDLAASIQHVATRMTNDRFRPTHLPRSRCGATGSVASCPGRQPCY
jgi:carbamoyltransferase